MKTKRETFFNVPCNTNFNLATLAFSLRLLSAFLEISGGRAKKKKKKEKREREEREEEKRGKKEEKREKGESLFGDFFQI